MSVSMISCMIVMTLFEFSWQFVLIPPLILKRVLCIIYYEFPLFNNMFGIWQINNIIHDFISSFSILIVGYKILIIRNISFESNFGLDIDKNLIQIYSYQMTIESLILNRLPSMQTFNKHYFACVVMALIMYKMAIRLALARLQYYP